jgi:MATE family multidrug resistance protein
LPLLLYGCTRRYLQGVGDVRVVTITIVAANLVNWFGNWVFIYGKFGMPALGVNGSAISTVGSFVCMAGVLLGFAWLHERKRGHQLFHLWAGPRLDQLMELVRLGAPAAGQVLLEIGAWNLATLSAGWLTPVALATHQIALNYASPWESRPPPPSASATPSALGMARARAAPDGSPWGWAQVSCCWPLWSFWRRRVRLSPFTLATRR